MKRLIIFLLLFAAIKVAGQTTGYLRFDTVKIMKQNGTCELYIINKTKDTLGILTNVGGGLTQFRKSRVLNDSTIVVGLDTLVIVGGVGGGGGSGSVTSISQGYGIVNTPNPITSTGTIRADTSGTNGLVTRTELLDSTDITTQVESPIYVKLRASWPVPDTLAIDTTVAATRARLYKVADSLIAMMATAGVPNTNTDTDFRWLIPSSQAIKTAANSSTITWDSTSNANSLTAQVPDAGITTAKIADNNVTNAKIVAFSPFPAQRTFGKIYEKSFWNNNAEDLQVGPSGNNTIAVSGGFITMTATGFSAANIIKIIPGRISTLNKSTLTAQIGIGTLTANAADIGLMGYSVITHSGAQFGYMGFIQTSTSGTSTVFIYDQARSSQKATATGFAYASNDIVEFTWDLRDTALLFTAHNLTSDPTGVNKKTATYNFTPNSSAHILPNSYNWAIYDGSGTGGTTRTLRNVKIESNDTQYPNLLILGNSKTKIGYATFWNGRFGMQLNATYPTTMIYAGGAERLSDMIMRLDEITALSPSQVLLADIASNSLRAGVAVADVVTQYRYIVSRLEGAGIRVLHMILPEDSTAGGLGQTAWHARLSAEYPSTYMAAVYDGMSTNNIADAGLIHADGIHLVQAGNDLATSLTIGTGMVQVISTQRRSEIRTNDRWIVKTGDSLHFSRKIFSRHNYVPRWDDNNQSLTTGVQYMDSLKAIFSMSSRPTSPLTNALVAVEGPIATYGVTGGRYMYDRTTPANNFAEYVNLNTLYRGYNGTDRHYIGTEGQMRIGNGASVSTTIMPSTLQLKRDQTFTTLFARKGFSFSSDSVVLTYSGSGALGDRSINSFHKAQMPAAGGATSYDTLSTVFIEGAPYNGTNVTINFPLALEVMFGKTHLGGGVSILNSPTGYGAYRIAVINPDSTLGTVTTASLGGVTQSALDDTAAAIRADITTPVQNYEMFYSDNSSTTVGNTTTEATLLGTGTGTAQFTGATAGCVLSIKGNGILSTASSAGTPILEFSVSNYSLGMNMPGLTGSLTNVFYDYDFEIIPVGIGASQDAIVHCVVRVEDGASAKTFSYSTRISASFTSAGTLSVDVTADWDVADVANTLTSYKNVVQIFRK